ncbi:MAG: hypothetical protein JST33_16420 [Actinobacteria bacterium]|nr:hypothetical protein [Actinomycetota bacterium]
MSSLTTLLASTETDGPRIFDAISGIASSMTTIFSFAAIFFGAVFCIMGVTRLMRTAGTEYSSGWGHIGAGVVVMATAAFLPWILGSFDQVAETDPTPSTKPSSTTSPEPTSTAAPTTAPETVQEPADLTWLLVVLGIIGALILAAVLIWILIAATGRARRSIRAARKEAEVERAGRERTATAWQAFHDRHNELLRKIVHSETDWDSLFFLPALTDPNVPQTYAMLRAMRAAGTQRDTAGELPANLPLDVDLTTLPYPRAVEAFAVAWDAAERNARRLGQKGVPHAERKLIKEIRTLLDMAENAAASSTERSLAYRRAQKLIESLETVHVPEKAIAQLEERQQLMITAN